MGGQVSVLEPGKSSTLLHGAERGDVSAVEKALDAAPLLVLHKGIGIGSTHDTAWHIAAAGGHVDVLVTLYKRTRAAIQQVKAKLVKKLKKPLSDEQVMSYVVNQLNSRNQSPLMFACYAGKADCAAALVKMGADPWMHDNCAGRTSLHYAAMHGHVDTVKAVMSALRPGQVEHYSGGRIVRLIDLRTVSGLTPLHYAAYAAKPGIVETLLEFGANPVAQTGIEGVHDLVSCPKWTTPLHLAAQQGHVEIVEAFLKHYMSRRHTATVRDPRLCADRARRLPVHVAKLKGHRHLIKLLHPLINLEEVFGDQIPSVGVTKLSVLAARALRRFLLAQADVADSMISTLPPLVSANVCGTNTSATVPGAVSGRMSRSSSIRSIRNRSIGNAGELQASQPAQSSQPGIMRRTFSGLRFRRADSHGDVDAAVLAAEQDWWVPDPPRPGTPDLGHAAPSADVISPAAVPQHSPFENAAAFWGAPTPDVAHRDGANRSSFMQRLRSIGRGRSSLGSEPGGTVAGDSPRSGVVAPVAPVAAPTALGKAALEQTHDELGQEIAALSALSWGTTAMVSALPSQADCVVCLEELYPLVVVPCLHRVCATCTRRMAMALDSKPLGCPVCRTNVKGVYAPHDVAGLGSALQSLSGSGSM